MLKNIAVFASTLIVALFIIIPGEICLANNNDSPPTNPVDYFFNDGYSPVKKKLDGGYILIEDLTLNFIYKEEYSPEDGQQLKYRIYDFKNIEVNNLPVLNVSYGENRYSFEFQQGQIALDKYYILEITDMKGDKWYLHFKHG
jgi:hypothetical protein